MSYRTPEQWRDNFERRGWVVTQFSHHGIEAFDPSSRIQLRMVVNFGSPPAEPTPEPTPPPPNIASATTPAKQLPLW